MFLFYKLRMAKLVSITTAKILNRFVSIPGATVVALSAVVAAAAVAAQDT